MYCVEVLSKHSKLLGASCSRNSSAGGYSNNDITRHRRPFMLLFETMYHFSENVWRGWSGNSAVNLKIGTYLAQASDREGGRKERHSSIRMSNVHIHNDDDNRE